MQPTRVSFRITIAIAFAAFSFPGIAQPFREDSSFNFTGVAGIDIDTTVNYSNSSALQADGKIVSGGSTYIGTEQHTLSRLNPDGSIDNTFGNNGYIASPDNIRRIQGVAIQPDGKIVAGGVTGNLPFTVVRYNPDGTLDSTFGTNGYALNSPTIYVSEMVDIAVQPDGKIVAIGHTQVNGYFNLVVMRINDDGSPDLSFNGTGYFFYAYASLPTYGSALMLQPDGKIVTGGYYYATGSNSNFLVIRLTTGGIPDTSFNYSGINTVALSDEDYLRHLSLQPDGKIIATGESIDNALGHYMSVARFTANGRRDSTFSGDGKILLNGRNGAASFPMPNGELVVAGTDLYNPLLARLKQDGSIDSTFGTNGYYTSVFGDANRVEDGFIQPDGKIVLTGAFTMSSALMLDMGAIRFIPGPVTTSIDTPVTGVDLLSVYPNPSDGRFRIDFPETIQEGILEIYSATGAMIYFRDIRGEAFAEIDHALTEQVLFVARVFDGEKNYSARIVAR